MLILRATACSFLAACVAMRCSGQGRRPDASAGAATALSAAQPVIETLRGLRIVHLFGTAQERGRAHGERLAADIVSWVDAELTYRFGERRALLEQARRMLPRYISFPDEVGREIDAIHAGMLASGVDLTLAGFERPLDLDDLRLVNALDVFSAFGCSGFTVWGEQVEGGGVLTTRNFDWPCTGQHMVDDVIVLVQHPAEGHAVASVTLPGYVGVVTGVSADGVAVFLHVGSGRTGMPDSDAMPTAIAVREAVMRAESPAAIAALGAEMLEETSPPASYISRFVLPRVLQAKGADAVPAVVFETDLDGVRRRRENLAPCVVTNHFGAHEAGGDSGQRYERIAADLRRWQIDGDRRVSVAEAWDALASVSRASPRFGTLHSLVFRAEPWVFELALGRRDADGSIVAAPKAGAARRHVLTREQLFEPRRPKPALLESGEADRVDRR